MGLCMSPPGSAPGPQGSQPCMQLLHHSDPCPMNRGHSLHQTGIEPVSSLCKSGVLPLNYRCAESSMIRRTMDSLAGIEPASLPSHGSILPLNHRCDQVINWLHRKSTEFITPGVEPESPFNRRYSDTKLRDVQWTIGHPDYCTYLDYSLIRAEFYP
jgi:hypothetical protein